MSNVKVMEEYEELTEEDRKLFEDTVRIYTSSSTIQEYNRRLKEYIEKSKIHKTTKYLNDLLRTYKKQLKGTLIYEMILNTYELLDMKSRRKGICEKIMGMTDEELENYLKENCQSDIKNKIKKYLESATNESEKEILQEIMYRIEKIEGKNQQTQQQQRYKRIIAMLDVMVDNGFFSYTEFSRQKHAMFDLESIEMKNHVLVGIKFLKEKYPEKYELYRNKIERNKIGYYLCNRIRIEDMLKRMRQNEYDIVDYYADFDISIFTFTTLYRELNSMGIINNEAKAELNRFFSPHREEICAEFIGFNSVNVKECNGTAITSEELENIIRFMNYYKINKNYFKLCYKKYKKGELDFFFDEQIKKYPK